MMQALNITIDYIDSDGDWLWISKSKISEYLFTCLDASFF
jgi:hypothetical protein